MYRNAEDALSAVLACFSAEQTPLPRSREEAQEEVLLLAIAAEAGHGGFDFRGRSGNRGTGILPVILAVRHGLEARATQQRLVQRGTGQRGVVEGDGEK